MNEFYIWVSVGFAVFCNLGMFLVNLIMRLSSARIAYIKGLLCVWPSWNKVCDSLKNLDV